MVKCDITFSRASEIIFTFNLVLIVIKKKKKVNVFSVIFHDFFLWIFYKSPVTGRGTNTHAYMHSVQAGHHVFLNLQTLRFYCIPDNYEIIDSSLDDITVRQNFSNFN